MDRYVLIGIIELHRFNSVHHQDLHSFPTRRYSDLEAVIDADDLLFQIRRSIGAAHEFSYTVGDRSEEHTSELQSLRHLVCRLLLEKENGAIEHTPHSVLTS